MNLTINSDMFNDQYLELYHKDTPIQLIFGSASSGKSYSMSHWIVLWAMVGRNIIVARKQQNQLRRSVFSEITKAISNLELDAYFIINKTDLTVLCKVSCGSILFVGVDDNSKLKSITAPQVGGVLDTLVMEEADAFTAEDFDQLRTRMRGISKHRKKTIMIFNPVSKLKMKWVWDRFFEPIDWQDDFDNYYEDDNIFIKRYNYLDNKFLGKDEKDAIESLKTRNPRFYRVFGEGKFGVTGKMVFDNNYKYEDFDIQSKLNDRSLTMHVGVDYGFVHKNAMVVSMYDQKNHKIYVCAEIGVRDKTKSEFANIIKRKLETYNLQPTIQADSAEPASTKELCQHGLRVISAKKGPDSLMRSLDFLQSQEIIIHPSCTQLYSEMETLTYKKANNGEYDEKVDDSAGDDLISALRYGYSHLYMARSGATGAHLKF